MMRCASLVRLLVLATVAAFSRSATADGQGPRASTLSWVRVQGAESCPAPIAIARLIEQRLGQNVFALPSRADLAVEAYVERHETRGWHASISLSKDDGTAVGHREFWSDEPTCTAVAESAAFAIALMIDPDAMLREPLSPALDKTPPSVLTTSPAPVANVPAPPIPPSPPATWRGAVELATGMGAGLLPGLSPGIFVRARAVEPSRTLGLEAEGAFFFEQRAELRANAGADFALLFAGVSLCGLPWGASRISALMCAGANLGSMTASGYGFSDTQPKSQNFIVNLTARARAAFRATDQWTVLVGGGLLVPLQRDHFETRVGTVTRELFRPSAVAGIFELGVAYEF